MFKKTGRYDGPRCYVPFDHKGPDGKNLKGGWHYSTKQHRKHGEIPDRPLHLHDLAAEGEPGAFKSEHAGTWHHADGSRMYYEYAEKHHVSWLDKHGPGNPVAIGGE